VNAPSAQDVADWGCSPAAPELRVVRNVACTGRIRVLATNLRAADFPCECFGDLYHARWKIKEAFKRFKHRPHLEAAPGLSQQTLIIDVAAKVLADKLASLLCLAAQYQRQESALPDTLPRRCNCAYAAHAMLHMLPSVLLFMGDVIAAIGNTIDLLARTTTLAISGRTSHRPDHRVKPHPRFAYKG